MSKAERLTTDTLPQDVVTYLAGEIGQIEENVVMGLRALEHVTGWRLTAPNKGVVVDVDRIRRELPTWIRDEAFRTIADACGSLIQEIDRDALMPARARGADLDQCSWCGANLEGGASDRYGRCWKCSREHPLDP
jgi:hypothetical protein